MGMCFLSFHSEGHIGLERKVTKLEAMVKMLQEDLKKVGEKDTIQALCIQNSIFFGVGVGVK